MSAAAPRPGLRAVEPYAAPQLDVRARLNTNESPYPLPDAFREDLGQALMSLDLHRYPAREAEELRTRLADLHGHSPEGTWCANGSNEVIQQLLQAYGGPTRRALAFEPTYALHSRIAWVTSTEVVRRDLTEPWVLGTWDVENSGASGADVVFVCSPNNPTGNAQPLAIIERFAEKTRGLVIVDEAYGEFCGTSAIGLLERYPNLVVVRTFSKAFALAGARLGYCLAAPAVVEDLRRVRLPYHLSSLAQAAGIAALDHRDEALAIVDGIRRQRDRLLEELPGLGAEVFPSDANFVLFRPPKPAAEVWQGLLERGVLVRDFSTVIHGCLRVTAGTPEEVDRFLSALEEVLA